MAQCASGNSASGNIRAGSGGASDYTQTCKVTQLSKTGGAGVRFYSLHYAFPTDLSPITLDWGDNDTIEEYTVTFSYDYFSATTGAISNGGTGPAVEDVVNDGWPE